MVKKLPFLNIPTIYILLSFLLSLFLLFTFTSKTYAQTTEQIQKYVVNTRVNSDGTINVIEEITYNFGNNQKHGIYRNLDTIKENNEGKKFKLTITDIVVVDQNNNEYTTQVEKQTNNVMIRVGDADKYVSGVKQYNIFYKVAGALTYFADFDELYWNFTGNSWEVDISNFEANVTLPSGIAKESIKASCYTGKYGSNESNCVIDIKDSLVSIKANKTLLSNEGITAGVSFPKNYVSVLEPKEYKDYSAFWGFVTSVIFILFGFFWYIFLPIKIFLNWYKDRKNTREKQKIVAAWFDPPKYSKSELFSPSETATLVNKKTDNKAVTSTIIHLAQRGYLKIIVRSEKDIFFKKEKDFKEDTKLKEFERDLLKALFKRDDEVTINDLKKNITFGKAVSKFNSDIPKELYERGMFEKNPADTQTKYGILGFLGLVFFGNLPLFISAFFFGRKSTKRTDLGIEKYSEAVSLRNFLISQDEKLDFQAQNQMFFEKLLPYATAFGVEDIWEKRFGELGIKLEEPSWYEGDISNIIVMSHVLNSSVSSAVSSSNTSSSSGFSSGSSGGGFSGGGGGGGGGGSW